MGFFEGRRVLVTGGTGMIGSCLIRKLLAHGAAVRTVSHSRGLANLEDAAGMIEISKGDLTRQEDCEKAVKGADCIFHLAAVVGGVAFNVAHPGMIYAANVLMTSSLLEAARKEGSARFLYTSSACVYPAVCKIPITEDECIVGEYDRPPEPTNGAYGWAKRSGEVHAKYCAQEYGMKIAVVRPFNAYGPGDSFDLQTSHVIPALIRKAIERQQPYRVWGNGEPSRDFVYVEDIAEAMLLAMQKSTDADPINLASGADIQIKDLVRLILKVTGYSGAKVEYEGSKPLGQMKRLGSTEKAAKILGWKSKVALEDGLKRTYEWYKKHQ
jgi:GDP-L-fucose synthase